MIAARESAFLDSTMTLSPKYSGSFGTFLRDVTTLHDLGKSSEHFQKVLLDDRSRTHEGMYLTTVQYPGPEALHSMRLLTPVLVTHVHYVSDDDVWIATDTITREYGVGDTRDEAIDDYVENLHAMAHWFRENRMLLGPLMERQLQTYRRLFHGL